MRVCYPVQPGARDQRDRSQRLEDVKASGTQVLGLQSLWLKGRTRGPSSGESNPTAKRPGLCAGLQGFARNTEGNPRHRKKLQQDSLTP